MRSLLALIAALAVLALPAPAAEEAHTIVAHVDGMVCDFCAQSLKKVFGKEPGVESVAIDLSAKTMTLTTAPGGAGPDDARIKKLIDHAGYTLRDVERQ